MRRELVVTVDATGLSTQPIGERPGPRGVAITRWPQWSRIPRFLISAFAAVNLLDELLESGALAGDTIDWLRLCASIVGYVAMGLTPWFAYTAAVLGATALGCVLLIGHGIGIEPTIILPCVTAVAVKTSRWPLFATIIGCVAWAAGLTALTKSDTAFWLYLSMILVSTLIGVAIRHLILAQVKLKREVRHVRAENQHIRQQEREQLARELHDVVAHQLTNISFQIMANRKSDDPEVLHATLDTIDHASRKGAHELRALVGSLRELTSAGDPVNTSEELAASDFTRLRIDAVVRETRNTLTQAGFSPMIEIAPGVTNLSDPLQTTISRILQEASTNIVRYGKPQSRCEFIVVLDHDEVLIHIASPLPDKPSNTFSWQASGLGLRGIRERVHLMGGSFNAGPVHGKWIIDADLPHYPGTDQEPEQPLTSHSTPVADGACQPSSDEPSPSQALVWHHTN